MLLTGSSLRTTGSARNSFSIASHAGVVTSKYTREPAAVFSMIETDPMSPSCPAITPVRRCRIPGPASASIRRP
jgi:hypothetical protein